jgi:hypothetical protein
MSSYSYSSRDFEIKANPIITKQDLVDCPYDIDSKSQTFMRKYIQHLIDDFPPEPRVRNENKQRGVGLTRKVKGRKKHGHRH